MFTEKELQEIRDFMKKAENPLIMFDDDPDGLCSYLLMKPHLTNSKGVVIKSSPKLDIAYLRKIEEYHPDYTFVLDKPLISQEFIDKAKTKIIWIDHHPPVSRQNIYYYNPLLKNKTTPPASYLCYKITKENLWIAMIGSIADWYIPKEFEEFSKEYKDLFDNKTDIEDILFETEFGKLIKIFSFILKGKMDEVKDSINSISKIKSPYEILNQSSPAGKYLYKRYERINKKYEALLEKALDQKQEGKIFIFIYPSTAMSFTADLGNELMHLFPDKIIIVGREKSGNIKMSLRSKEIDLPLLIQKALHDIEGYGGGHKNAAGGSVKNRDFHRFIENIKKELK